MDTEFHRVMRERMKTHYHTNGGRKKKIVRYYLKKHNLTKEFLQDTATLDDQIRKLKMYHLQQQMKSL